MAQRLSQLAIGSKIKFLTFYGERIVWRLIGQNLAGMPSQSATLYMDKIVCLHAFDAKEPSNSDSNRKNYGNNDWGVSNLRQWANSDASAGHWYSAQHSADAPPSTGGTSGAVYYNAYTNEPGFLYESEQRERDLLLATTRQYAGWSGNSTTSVDKLFPLTSNEVNLESIANNGTRIPYFTDNNSRITQCTAQCIAKSEYTGVKDTATNWYYWLQNSYPSYSVNVRLVHPDGTLYDGNAYYGAHGVRLACNLQSSILVSDSTDEDGCYTIVFNLPPTAPETLEVPTTIRANSNTEIKWSAGTDPEGNLTGYILQRNLDSGEWGEIYRGSGRSYNDTVPLGTATVQYRVQSYDNESATSAWTTSGVRSVINNQPPEIHAGAIDLQTVTMTAPKLQYTVTDADGDTVTVKEYLDDTVIKTHQPELGHENIMTMDADAWKKVLNGEHVYKIVATDDKGDSASAQAKFTKQVGSIDFTLKNPMEADERPTQALINIAGTFPAGCELKVEMCNNGLDEEPTWVDCTNESKNGMKVFFANEDKTAEKWAVGVRVHLARNSAEGDVNIVALGGNFA